MFNVSWGELFVVIGVSVYMVGSKDLPKVAGVIGTQVGRVVGLLQGARVRADKFTAESELRALQNELRSGLRDLDQVRSEMAVAVSAQGMVGRNLGSTVSGANRQVITATKLPSLSAPTTTTGIPSIDAAVPGINNPPGNSAAITSPAFISQVRELAPRSQSVAAVAEEEWQKQGIAFQSRAERGFGDQTGSGLLASLYQQTLIHDQHDRVVQEQDQAVFARFEEKQKGNPM